MSKRLGLSVVAASFLFGSAPGVAGGSTTIAVHSLATSSSGHDDVSARLAKWAGLPSVTGSRGQATFPRPRICPLLIWICAGWTKRSIAS